VLVVVRCVGPIVLRRPFVVTRNLPPVVLVPVELGVWRGRVEWVVELTELACVVGGPAVVGGLEVLGRPAVVGGLEVLGRPAVFGRREVVGGLTLTVGLSVVFGPRVGVVVTMTVDEVVVGSRRRVDVRLLLGRLPEGWTTADEVTGG
jgi:hypothetical protein